MHLNILNIISSGNRMHFSLDDALTGYGFNTIAQFNSNAYIYTSLQNDSSTLIRVYKFK